MAFKKVVGYIVTTEIQKENKTLVRTHPIVWGENGLEDIMLRPYETLITALPADKDTTVFGGEQAING